MSAGGTQSNLKSGSVEPENGGVHHAARAIESRNANVTATLLLWAFPQLGETLAQEYAVIIEQKKALHGEPAAVLYVRELAERINR